MSEVPLQVVKTAWDPEVGGMCQACRDSVTAGMTAQVKRVGARYSIQVNFIFFFITLEPRVE